jgi:hypothetical protein
VDFLTLSGRRQGGRCQSFLGREDAIFTFASCRIGSKTCRGFTNKLVSSLQRILSLQCRQRHWRRKLTVGKAFLKLRVYGIDIRMYYEGEAQGRYVINGFSAVPIKRSRPRAPQNADKLGAKIVGADTNGLNWQSKFGQSSACKLSESGFPADEILPYWLRKIPQAPSPTFRLLATNVV